jgi:hypothetical protein
MTKKAYRSKLDPELVRQADDQFYAAHPERVRDGNRVPIAMDSSEEDLADEWKEIYRSLRKAKEKSEPTSTIKAGDAVADCPQCICQLKSMTVKCGHSKGTPETAPRKAKLSLPAEPRTDGKRSNVLQVIAGPEKKPDTICLELKESKSQCGQHRPVKIQWSGGPNAEQGTLDSLTPELKVHCEPWDPLHDPFKYLFLDEEKTPRATYELVPHYCSIEPGTAGPWGPATVEVFPDVAWEWSLGLQYMAIAQATEWGERDVDVYKPGSVSADGEITEGRFERESSGIGYSKQEQSLSTSRWAVSGSAKLTYDGTPYEFKSQIENKLKDVLKFVEYSRDLYDAVIPDLKQHATKSITIDALKFKVGYKASFTEHATEPWVHATKELSFGAEPLLKMTGKCDILETLIGALGKAGPAAYMISKVLLAAKQACKEGVKAGKSTQVSGDIAMELSASGECSLLAKCSWTGQEPAECSGEARGEVAISLEGKAEASASVLCVKFKKGYKLGAKSGIVLTGTIGADDDGTFLTGKFQFNGLQIYYASYRSAGAELKATSKADGSAGEPGDTESTKTRLAEPELSVEPTNDPIWIFKPYPPPEDPKEPGSGPDPGKLYLFKRSD